MRYRSVRPDDAGLRARLVNLRLSGVGSAIAACFSCYAGREHW